jgi:hypothetical protein
MNLLNKLKAGFAATAVSFVALATFASPIVSAIPYTGDNTPPAPAPAFNVYTGVPSEGNEADFFRGKVEGDTSASVNDVRSSCETGKRFTLRVYVHNGASVDLNNGGNGPSVAKNSKVKVDLKNATAKSAFAPEAAISASNAATVNDGMTITCTDGKTVNLNYVTGTAKQFSRAGTKALSDSIVTTGALVGTDNPDGNVWGCWEQRVYVTLTVEVKEAPKPVVGDGVCKVTDVTIVDRSKRTVKSTVTGVTTGQGASIVGYEINWGDGTITKNISDTHTYAKDGTYTITARVQVRMPDGTTKWVTSPECTRKVTFEAGKPPVVPPVTPPTTITTLPETGVGGLAGIFTGTTVLAAGAHHIVTRRRARS